MIQFNKTFFQFAKRLALVLAGVIISSAVWAAEDLVTKPGKASATVTVKTNVAEGKVYIKHDALGRLSDSDKNASLTINSTEQGVDPDLLEDPGCIFCLDRLTWLYYTAAQYYAEEEGWTTPELEQIITLGAEDISNLGFVFDGWYTITTSGGGEVWTPLLDETGLHKTSLETTVTLNVSTSGPIVYGAKWVKPEVTGPYPESTIIMGIIDDKNETLEGNAIFTVSLSNDTANFIASTGTNATGANIGFKRSGTATIASVNNELNYTMPIIYHPTGIHNTSETGGITGYAKLKSKIYDITPDPIYQKSIKLVAYEDYTPIFTAAHKQESNPYTFKSAVTIGGSITSDAGIYPELVSYSAKQPLGTNEGTKWTYTITSVKDATNKNYPTNLFEISSTVGGKPIVTFKPGNNPSMYGFTEGIEDDIVLYATMSISCSYYDALGNEVPAEAEQNTYIQVTVEQKATTILEIIDDNGEYDFGTITIGEPVEPIKLNLYTANITFDEDACDLDNEELFVAATPANGQVEITIPTTLLCNGEYEATLTIKGTPTANEVESKEASILLKAKLELAKPKVYGAGSNKQVTFGWASIAGADTYKIYIGNDRNNLDEIEDPEIQQQEGTPYLYYVHTTTDNYTPIYCQIEASQSKCKPNGAKLSEIVNAIPTMDKIDNSNKSTTGIWSGIDYENKKYTISTDRTEGSTYREVNVTDAFSSDGEPIFDKLYIYGETTPTSGKSITMKNAITPLYVFEKDKDNKCYNLNKAESSYTIANVRTTRKAAFQTIDLNQNSNLKSLYFTGYCPYASTTETITVDEEEVIQDGVIHIIGGKRSIDLYLNDLQIYAEDNDKDITLDMTSLESIKNNGYFYDVVGSGAVFAVQPTASGESNMLNVNMHIQNDVILDAAKGADIEINMFASTTEGDQQLISDKPDHFSSPIQVLLKGGANASSTSTKLTIDDKWNGQRKYASLKLIEICDEDNDAGISINLGNANTQLVIDGVNIVTQPIAAAYTQQAYPATSTQTWIARGIKATTTNTSYKKEYTIGTGSSLSIKDGTFASSSEHIKCYTQSLTVDGGSFITPIQHYATNNATTSTTPIKNSYGENLERATINCANNEYGKDNANNQFVVSNFDKMVDDLFPDYGFNTNETTHQPLSAYYNETTTLGKRYGYGSLYLDGTDQIYPMLPWLDCKKVHLPWLVCAPELMLKYGNYNINWGGGITKAAACQTPNHNTPYMVDNLLFTEIDEYTRAALNRKYFTTIVAGGIEISLGKDKGLYSTINNAVSYTIQNNAYILKPIVAAKWMLFTAPFDIKKVSIIESYPERQLALDYDAVRGKIPEDKVNEARQAQAERFVELYSFWYSATTGSNANNIVIDPENESSFIYQWMLYEAGKGKNGIANQTEEEAAKYKPSITELVHFTGDPNGAHYYLYESNGEWQYDNDNDKFTTTWNNAQIGEDGLIMKKGRVYAIYFPYGTYTGVHNPSTTWDYWTGKYLLLESKDGPIEIGGSNDVTFNTSSTNTAILHGNLSFADVTIPKGKSVWSLEKNPEGIENTTGRDIHDFVQGESQLSPMEGFLMADFVTSPGKRAIAINYRTGEVTYEEIENPDDDTPGLGTGVPTIMGDLTLIVEPTSEGLTITPIKEQHVMLFDANGKMIFSKHLSAEENVTLPTGVYVVRGEYEQVKAIKK